MEKNEETLPFSHRCRCCLKKGRLRKLWGDYYRKEEREVYGEMLMKCFAISWEKSTTHEEQICFLCIKKLTDACEFKRIVLSSEEKLLEYGEEGLLDEKDGTEINQITPKKEIFPITITPKKEFDDEDVLYFEDHDNELLDEVNTNSVYLDEDDDNTDLEKAATKAAQDSIQATSTSPAPVIGNTQISKAFLTREEVISSAAEKKYKLTSQQEKIVERSLHQDNLRCLLLYTNASPLVRRTDQGYLCCFCTNKFMDPADLKRHCIEDHDDETKAQCMKDKEMSVFTIKLDITNLQCNICDKDIKTLEEALGHLKNEHNLPIHLDIKNLIVPFKFGGKGLYCFICSQEFPFFKTLARHMTLHYKNYQCESCGIWFINQRALQKHRLRHTSGTFPCSHCDKVFDAKVKRTYHERTVHILKKLSFTCSICGEKFKDGVRKSKHLHVVHGQEQPEHRCQICNKIYFSKNSLRKHTEKLHLKIIRHICDECGKGYCEKKDLDRHKLTHSKIREYQHSYQCNICHEEFNRKTVLNLHMRIHYDDKSYPCEICGEVFVHPQTRRKHMNKNHGVKE